MNPTSAAPKLLLDMPRTRQRIREKRHDEIDHAVDQRARAQDLDLRVGRALGGKDPGDVFQAGDPLLLLLHLDERVRAIDRRRELGVEQAKDHCPQRDGEHQPARGQERPDVLVQAAPVAFLDGKR